MSRICRGWIVGLMLVPFALSAQAQEPATTPPTVTPVPAEVASPEPAIDRPAPVAKPRPPAPPRPVEKPRISEPPPAEPAATRVTEPPGEAAATASPATAGPGVAGWLLAFAMLIVGFAAGFAARHFWSRHQLGGMQVRIGTWRGIP